MSQRGCEQVLLALAILLLASSVSPLCQADEQSLATTLMQRRAIAILRAAMTEGKDFEKVHAAEALIWSEHTEGIKDCFLEEDRIASCRPDYRLGIWRILCRVNANNLDERHEYLRKILAVLSDPKALDRGNAAETLAKLGYVDNGQTTLVSDLAKDSKADLRVWSRWILANSGRAEDEAYLAELMKSNTPKDRSYTAYAFRDFKTIRPTTLKVIQGCAATESFDSEARHYILGTLYTHLPAEKRESVKQELLRYVMEGNTDQRSQACMALANWPTEDMIPAAEKLLDSGELDERVGAAYLLLRMDQPNEETGRRQ